MIYWTALWNDYELIDESEEELLEVVEAWQASDMPFCHLERKKSFANNAVGEIYQRAFGENPLLADKAERVEWEKIYFTGVANGTIDHPDALDEHVQADLHVIKAMKLRHVIMWLVATGDERRVEEFFRHHEDDYRRGKAWHAPMGADWFRGDIGMDWYGIDGRQAMVEEDEREDDMMVEVAM